MSSKHSAAIWATGVAGVIMLVGYGVYQIGEREADWQCYADVPAYATWKDIKPLVDEYVSDDFLTQRECGNLKAAYETAQTKQNRLEYLAKYKK